MQRKKSVLVRFIEGKSTPFRLIAALAMLAAAILYFCPISFLARVTFGNGDVVVHNYNIFIGAINGGADIALPLGIGVLLLLAVALILVVLRKSAVSLACVIAGMLCLTGAILNIPYDGSNLSGTGTFWMIETLSGAYLILAVLGFAAAFLVVSMVIDRKVKS